MKIRARSTRFPRLLLALAVASLPIPSPAAAAAASTSPKSLRASSQQAPTFRSAVTRVAVDAIVTDGDGNFIDDLKAEDFRIFEDGVEQEIVNVQLTSLASGQVTNVGSRTETATESSPSPRSPAALGAVVYFIDLPSLDRSNQPQLVETFQSFFEGEGDLDVPQGVFILDNSGRLHELAALTTDREQLRNAANVVSEAGASVTSIFSRMTREYGPVMKTAIDAMNSAAGGVSSANETLPVNVREVILSLERKAERDSEIEHQRAERTLNRLIELTQALSAMEGRTALVWISSGAMITGGGPYAAFVAAVREAVDAEARSSSLTRTSPEEQLLGLMEELYETANTGNVSIYSIDPRPISELSNLGTRAGIGNNQVSNALRRNVRPAYSDLTAPLVDAASNTGGRAFIGWADLDRAFEEQYTDASQFYLIFYQPPAPHEDGEYHQIEVRVALPDAEVRARPGYRELTDSELRTRKVNAAMALPGAVTGRPLPTRAFHRFAPDGSSKILVIAGLPRPAETLTGSWAPAFGQLDPNEDLAEEMIERLGISLFSVHALAFNRATGATVETHEAVEPTGDPGTQSSGTTSRYFHYTTEWQVTPGFYEVRLLVAEESGDRLGTSRLHVDVPPSANQWLMADPMLVEVDTEAGLLRPLVTESVLADSRVAVSVQVSGAVGPLVEATIRHAVTGQVMAEITPKALPLESQGVHGAVLPLPYLDPDDYVVELRIVDTTVDQRTARSLPLHVEAPR